MKFFFFTGCAAAIALVLLAARIGEHMSTDALGMALGILLGVLAGVPMMLVLLGDRRQGARSERYDAPRVEAPPRVIVVDRERVRIEAQRNGWQVREYDSTMFVMDRAGNVVKRLEVRR